MSKKTLENNSKEDASANKKQEPQGEMQPASNNEANLAPKEKEIPTCPLPAEEAAKSFAKVYQEHEVQMAKNFYDKYCEAVGGVSFKGEKLPSAEEFFEDLNCSNAAHGWKEVAAHAYASFVEAQGHVKMPWRNEEEHPINKAETFFDRLVAERGELVNRHMRLTEFFKSDKINTVSDVQRKLLKKQLIAMAAYCDILDLRIEDLREV